MTTLGAPSQWPTHASPGDDGRVGMDTESGETSSDGVQDPGIGQEQVSEGPKSVRPAV
ncbi:MAG: hypothetical protein JWR13_2869 [Mycobacterium sp.]|jgi:hypothetical protein|nr:hypothetical protein [Mycobacterium sp.]MDT5313460.1 hypothetical protein [Mycobacterium sp.]